MMRNCNTGRTCGTASHPWGVLLLAIALCAGCMLQTALAQTLDVDFGRVVRSTGPHMFGGAHVPPPEHPGAMEALRGAGVTHIRFDISLEQIVPGGITLDDYLANRNGVADPARWNWAPIESEIRRVREAGLAAYGILLWNPPWLTKNGRNNGEVWNYDVWEDIVRKVLTRIGSRFEYIEIWNEPCWTAFLDLGKDFSVDRVKQVTVEYHRRALAAAEGLGLKLGGPAAYGWWRDELIQAVLADDFVRQRISFISWHHYDRDHADYPDFERTVQMVRAKAGRDLDIHVSEWNYSADQDSYPDFENSPRAAAWDARKLIQWYGLGVDSATMYHLSNGPWGYEYKENNGKWGGYEWRNGKPVPYGFLSSFSLLSSTLGLGRNGGAVNVVASTAADLPVSVNAVALKNADQANLVLLANHGSPHGARVSLRVKATAPVTVQTFQIDDLNKLVDVAALSAAVPAVPKDGVAVIPVEVPAYGVLALRLSWSAAGEPRKPAAPVLNPIR